MITMGKIMCRALMMVTYWTETSARWSLFFFISWHTPSDFLTIHYQGPDNFWNLENKKIKGNDFQIFTFWMTFFTKDFCSKNVCSCECLHIKFQIIFQKWIMTIVKNKNSRRICLNVYQDKIFIFPLHPS